MFTRASGWQAEYFYLGDTIAFESIGVTIAVADIYYQVDNEDMAVFLETRESD